MAAPEAHFVQALAAGVLRQESPAPPERTAHEALREALSAQKSLVLDVQFTGFSRRGEAVGGVDPLLLRAAAQLIILRVSRLGFTAEATEDDLRALLSVLGRPPAEMPPGGVVSLLREAAPRGVYLGTSGGEAYRPPAAPGPEPAQPPAEAPENASAAAEEEPQFWDFDIVDLPGGSPRAPEDAAPAPPPPAEGEGRGAPPPPPPRAAEEPPADDLYHFFRTAARRGAGEDAEELAASLRAADTLNRFNELTQAAAAAVPRLLESGEDARAVRLLGVLVEEARRPDRTRIFRDSAVQALRRTASETLLARLADLLSAGGELRERILPVLLFVGGDALSVLEGVVLRTGDPELRETVFRSMLAIDPSGRRLLERAMEDPVVTRARAVLELAGLPEVDPALTQRWAERAAAHRDPSVRQDVVRVGVRLGGKGGMRLLLDRLADDDPAVRRAAVHALGGLGDAAAVPFLARVLNESGDEELQLDAVRALGRIASPEGLPVLTGVLGRRQLFGGKRLLRLKSAAVAAVGKIPGPAAREVLESLAGGRDAELAAEARRALAAAGEAG